MDDLQIPYLSTNLRACERQFQLALDKLAKFTLENSLSFSTSRTVPPPSYRIRGLFHAPTVKINGHDLAATHDHKTQGIAFDKKLTFLAQARKVPVRETLESPEDLVS